MKIMALLATPLGENAATIACTNCKSSLIVSARSFSGLLLRMLAAQIEKDHQCSGRP